LYRAKEIRLFSVWSAPAPLRRQNAAPGLGYGIVHGDLPESVVRYRTGVHTQTEKRYILPLQLHLDGAEIAEVLMGHLPELRVRHVDRPSPD
jgi:hypothetical protein